MGQRHQIYLKLPYEIEYPTDQIGRVEKSDIIGLHHQWLYGTLPLRQLIQFMSFFDKNKTQRDFSFGTNAQHSTTAEDTFDALYSINFKDGTYSSTSRIVHSYIKDPLAISNNDGVTLIDLTNVKNPKYAFLFFGDTAAGKALTPLTAEQYVRDYYNPTVYLDENFWNDKSIAHMEKDIQNLLKSFKTKKSFKVLSLKDVKEKFPMFYASV